MFEADVKNLYNNIMSDKSSSVNLRIQVLKNLQTYLQEEDTRMQQADRDCESMTFVLRMLYMLSQSITRLVLAFSVTTFLSLFQGKNFQSRKIWKRWEIFPQGWAAPLCSFTSNRSWSPSSTSSLVCGILLSMSLPWRSTRASSILCRWAIPAALFTKRHTQHVAHWILFSRAPCLVLAGFYLVSFLHSKSHTPFSVCI